jgi:ORF6N domain
MSKPTSIQPDSIEQNIRLIRGRKVILDYDLAALYSVATHRFNEAVKRNADRFPSDFCFQLTPEEAAKVTVESVVKNTHNYDKQEVNYNSSQFAMSSRRHRGGAYLPWAFTEHGALMAANILRSQRASEMSVFVIRAFIKMREVLAANTTILKRLAEIDQALLVHDSGLSDVYQKLRPLLTPVPEPEKPKIGFHPGNR